MNVPTALAVLIAIASQAFNAPPVGYRRPTDSDFVGGWQALRGRDPEPFVVRADFDSDGAPDEAWLLPGESGGFALFAYLSRAGASPEVVRLAGAKTWPIQSHRIEVAAVGRHETACGKGYWACDPGEPAFLELRSPGIMLQQIEGASSIFWWNPKTHRFVRTWFGD